MFIKTLQKTLHDTSNYEFNRPLQKGKKKKIIGLMKDPVDGKFMKKSYRIKNKNIQLFNR